MLLLYIIFKLLGLLMLIFVCLKIAVIIIEGCRLLILIEVRYYSFCLIVGIQVLRHHCIRVIMFILGRICNLKAVAYYGRGWSTILFLLKVVIHVCIIILLSSVIIKTRANHKDPRATVVSLLLSMHLFTFKF